MLLRQHNRSASIDDLRQRYIVGRDGLNMANIVRILTEEGGVPHVYRTTASGVALLTSPAICYWTDHHYVVTERFHGRKVTILDPGGGRRVLTTEEFERDFRGIAITLGQESDVRSGQLPSQRSLLGVYARRHRTLIGLVLLASLVMAGVSLALPEILRLVLPDPGQHRDAAMLLVLFGLGLGYALAVFFRGLAGVMASLAVGRSLSRDLFSRLMRLPYQFSALRGPGDLLFTLSAVQELRSLITTDLVQTLVSAVLVVAVLVWITWVSPLGVAVALALVLLVVLISVFSARAITSVALEETQNRVELERTQVASITALEMIKTNALEEHYIERWNRDNDALLKQFGRLQTLQTGFSSVTMALQFIGPLLILLVLVLTRADMPMALVVSVQTLSGVLLGQVSSMAGSYTKLSEGAALLERVADVLLRETPQGFRGVHNWPMTGDLSVRGLSFAYGSFAAPVLQDVSFDAPAGSKIAIVGPSGCGKTTLGRLLVGLYTTDQGQITIDGVDMYDFDRERFHAQVAYVPQNVTLNSGTVSSNISWGMGKVSQAEIERAARDVGLHDEIAELPLGYDTPIAQLGDNFSGGQKQRIVLARAALKAAKLVVLDEATSSLDNRSEDVVSRFFGDLSCTRIVIAHRLSTVVDSDCILVMEAGRIVESGTHRELMRIGGRYADLYSREPDQQGDAGEIESKVIGVLPRRALTVEHTTTASSRERTPRRAYRSRNLRYIERSEMKYF